MPVAPTRAGELVIAGELGAACLGGAALGVDAGRRTRLRPTAVGGRPAGGEQGVVERLEPALLRRRRG